jgi:hypothetical protein
VTYGEAAASDELRRIQETFGWNCVMPEHAQKVELSE